MQLSQFFKSNVSKPAVVQSNATTEVVEQKDNAVSDLVDRWQRVVKVNPDDKNSRLQLLEAYVSAFQWNEADLLLDKLKAEYPDDYQVRLNLAKVIQRKGSAKEIREVWAALHKDYPDMLDPIIGLARSHNVDDDQETAIKLVDKALSIDSKDNRAHLIKGKIKQRQNMTDEAIEIYFSILEREPDHYEAEANLSSALLKQERYEELKPRLEKAMKMHPNQTSFNMFLFRMHAKQDNHTEALKVIDGLLMRDGKNSKVEYYLEKSDLLLKLGRNDEADAVCEAALQSYPNNVKLLTLYARVGQRKLRTA
ncbi:MAG: tetratricopeptide repeat protein [Granulosicoccus sp.]